MSVSLATRGMIRSCCKKNAIISFAFPQTQQILEVRPKIRQAAAPPPPTDDVPIPTSIQELRPVTSAKAPPTPVSSVGPVPTSAQELRPIIKKITED